MQTASTEKITNYRIALHGFQIVAFRLGEQLVKLPNPAVRILGVVLWFSATGVTLVVDFLDTELQDRQIREAVEEAVRIEIEDQRAVTFITESGRTESVPLKENQYSDGQ
ncbi:hypothetical protein [Maioricimonas sp. JC845]|uniref:hypothetical protein n=1 Tax=Maioricimonas sp. JC845 TaxID=3232138 RepID=UPI003457B672